MATATKKCVNCKERDRNENMKQTPNKQWFCGDDCIAQYANKKYQKVKQVKQYHVKVAENKKVKASNKAHAERKKAFKDNDKPLRIKAAQMAFNAFIRARDAKLPCISCNRSTGAKINAGHYKSVGSTPALRFEELNCHLQCEHCNMFKSGNIENYRPALIDKIGLDKVIWLEGPHEPKKYTCAELKEIELLYKQKIKKYLN